MDAVTSFLKAPMIALLLSGAAALLAPSAQADATHDAPAMCDPNNPSAACEPRHKASGGVIAEEAQHVSSGGTIRPEDLPVEAIREIVRDYLIEHPEVLLEAQRALNAKREAERAELDIMAVARHADELLRDPDAPVGGNPDGPIAVVEFFDYRCGHCRRTKPVLDQILAANPDVRLIYKEFPILGEESVIAARAALAARAQGGYHAFHDALMRAPGSLDRAGVLSVADAVGLDVERLAADMDDPALIRVISRNHRLAERLDIRGTPNFVIGERVIRGAPTLEQFEQLIALARADYERAQR